MSGYIIILIFIISFSSIIFDFIGYNRLKNYIYYVILAILFYFAASKDYNTCFDTMNYTSHFNLNKGINFYNPAEDMWYEPGYLFLESIVKTFTTEVKYLFIIISLISITLLNSLIKKYSPYPLLSLYLYISLFYFKRDIITIRYGISALLLLWGLILLIEKKRIKSGLFIILSMLFHYSSISVLSFIPFYYIFKNKPLNQTEAFILFALFIALLGINILSVIEKIEPLLPSYLSFGITKGLAHLDTDVEGGYKQIIPYIPYLFLFNKKRLENLSKGLIIILLFAVLCMIELNQVASFARINQLYLTSIILLAPVMIKKSSSSQKKYSILSYTVILGCYMFIRICFFNSGGFINIYW